MLTFNIAKYLYFNINKTHLIETTFLHSKVIVIQTGWRCGAEPSHPVETCHKYQPSETLSTALIYCQ